MTSKTNSDKKSDTKAGGGFPTGGVVFYEGQWTSEVYPWLVAHGTVAAHVNYDKKTATILLRYDGVFRKGTTETLETKIESNANTAVSNADIPNRYTFSLKGPSGGTESGTVVVKQKLQFTASSITRESVTGNYKSRSPQDHGTFQMRAISQQRFQEFANQSGSCTIM